MKRATKQTTNTTNTTNSVAKTYTNFNSNNELTIGDVVDINETGSPLINYPTNSSSAPVLALSTIPVGKDAIGRQVAVMFAGHDFQQPVVIGLIRNALDVQAEEEIEADLTHEIKANDLALNVKVDNEKLVISAEKEIVLQCGESSITLTKAGKVLIRGSYLLNRSSGVNSIKGAAVQIN